MPGLIKTAGRRGREIQARGASKWVFSDTGRNGLTRWRVVLVFVETLTSRGAATVHSQGREPRETQPQNPKAPQGRQDGAGQFVVQPLTQDQPTGATRAACLCHSFGV